MAPSSLVAIARSNFFFGGLVEELAPLPRHVQSTVNIEVIVCSSLMLSLPSARSPAACSVPVLQKAWTIVEGTPPQLLKVERPGTILNGYMSHICRVQDTTLPCHISLPPCFPYCQLPSNWSTSHWTPSQPKPSPTALLPISSR